LLNDFLLLSNVKQLVTHRSSSLLTKLGI